jgi:hypothetical protein
VGAAGAAGITGRAKGVTLVDALDQADVPPELVARVWKL